MTIPWLPRNPRYIPFDAQCHWLLQNSSPVQIHLFLSGKYATNLLWSLHWDYSFKDPSVKVWFWSCLMMTRFFGIIAATPATIGQSWCSRRERFWHSQIGGKYLLFSVKISGLIFDCRFIWPCLCENLKKLYKASKIQTPHWFTLPHLSTCQHPFIEIPVDSAETFLNPQSTHPFRKIHLTSSSIILVLVLHSPSELNYANIFASKEISIDISTLFTSLVTSNK